MNVHDDSTHGAGVILTEPGTRRRKPEPGLGTWNWNLERVKLRPIRVPGLGFQVPACERALAAPWRSQNEASDDESSRSWRAVGSAGQADIHRHRYRQHVRHWRSRPDAN